MYVLIDTHRGARSVLMFAAAYLAVAIVSLALTKGVSGIAAIWPASGVMLAAVLLLRRPERGWLYLAVFVASVFANKVIGGTLWSAVAFSCANIAEAWLARLLILRFCEPAGNLANPRNILLASIAAAIAALFSAAIASALTLAFGPEFILSWATTVFFGMMTIAPALLFLSADWERVKAENRMVMIVVVSGLVAISALTFWQNHLPLLWLPLAATGYATYRLGLTGAALSLLILALFAATHSAAGFALPGQIPADLGDTTFLQIYLIGVLVSILPLASLLETKNLMLEKLTEARNEALGRAMESQRIAETDGLTGVANRTKAMSVLNAAVAHSLAEGAALSILMVDIDHFKAINDRFGHAIGDQALVMVAREGQASSADGLFARIGGEEFLLILPGSDIARAKQIAETIQQRIRAIDWSFLGLDALTLSIGVTQHAGHQDASDLLATADYHLYAAKRHGRDCVRAAA